MYKVVKNGKVWSEYEDYEEASDVANELNSNLIYWMTNGEWRSK